MVGIFVFKRKWWGGTAGYSRKDFLPLSMILRTGVSTFFSSYGLTVCFSQACGSTCPVLISRFNPSQMWSLLFLWLGLYEHLPQPFLVGSQSCHTLSVQFTEQPSCISRFKATSVEENINDLLWNCEQFLQSIIDSSSHIHNMLQQRMKQVHFSTSELYTWKIHKCSSRPGPPSLVRSNLLCDGEALSSLPKPFCTWNFSVILKDHLISLDF